jgi:hypothetical protein
MECCVTDALEVPAPCSILNATRHFIVAPYREETTRNASSSSSSSSSYDDERHARFDYGCRLFVRRNATETAAAQQRAVHNDEFFDRPLQLTGHRRPVTAVAVDPSQTWLVTCSSDRLIFW